MKHLKNIATITLFLGCIQMYSCRNAGNNPSLTDGSHPMIADSKTAITSTESGQVIGYVHRGVYNFKGIPYARAERFMPPTKPEPWEGVRSSRAYGPVCPINVASMILSDELEFAQQHNFWFMKEEECLNLNVWTQALNDGGKRPVMVWLHGGGYTAGSSCELPTYDGENLSLTTDVVVVSVNHRLNVLGFLDLSAIDPKYAASANVGIMDLVAALEWVHNNIENFGGDPANVTIFGQSGGGGKVTTLMYTPSAKGLFHKAIMQSGGGGGFYTKELTRKVGLALLAELGLTTQQLDKINDIPHDELLEAGNRAIAKVNAEGNGRVGWGPCQDGDFIPFQPGDPGAEDLAKDVPLIIGTNQCEFGPSMRDYALVHASEDTIISRLRNQYGDKTEAYVEAFRKAYPNTTLSSDMLDIDVGMRPRALQFATLKSSVPGGAPVYNYLFKWNAPHMEGMFKSMHCMEIAFVFNTVYNNEQYSGGTPEAYALADKISKTWASFARTGDPNAGTLPEWESYTEENGATMILDNTSEMRYHHDQELLEVVSSL
ncbi:MAG: carboxylesterase/lipase family protein [Bacteroidales bacterium]|nr:carboxylesterase/lipase family protein [Bacteroidales bacterium]